MVKGRSSRSLNWELVRLFTLLAAVPTLLASGLILQRSNAQREQARSDLLQELARVYAYNAVERLRASDLEPTTELDWDRLMWGQVEASTLPSEISLFVFDGNQRLMYHWPSATNPLFDSEDVVASSMTDLTSRLEAIGSRSANAGFPTRARGGSQLSIVLAEPAAALRGPFYSRQPILLLVASFLGALLVVIPLVRRGLRPLTSLNEGHPLLSEGDSEERLPVTKYSEFNTLFASLERLSRSLNQRGESLQMLEHVGRQMEAAPREEDIVETVLRGSERILRCLELSCLLLPRKSDPSNTVATRTGSRLQPELVTLTDADISGLWSRATVENPKEPFSFEAPLANDVERVRFAVRINGRTRGVIWADWRHNDDQLDEGKRLGRSLARQLELALAKIEQSTELAQFSAGAIGALARAIDATSTWTRGHSDRVSEMAPRFGDFIGLPSSEVAILREGGLVHDIGKIAIDSSILDKDGPLSEDDKRQIQRHPEVGYQILEPLPGFESVLGITLQHHEWWNGQGYPNRLAGEEIDFLARVTALVDVFDALTSPRPYRTAFSHQEARAMIAESSGKQFDPSITPRFLDFLRLTKTSSGDAD